MTYDGGGNLLTDNRLGVAYAYSYNKRNRMSGATVGALPYAYGYNGLEQLVTRAQTGGPMMFTTHFVHDIFGNVIAETAGGGATGPTGTVREYIWLPETEIAPTSGSRTTIDRPLAVVDAVNTASPATYWVSVDHLNRPFRMTNAARNAVWDAVWQPWGGVHSITGTVALDARFPGQWFQRADAGGHPKRQAKMKPACTSTGTAATIRHSVATRSPIRWDLWMGRVYLGMRVGVRRDLLMQKD